MTGRTEYFFRSIVPVAAAAILFLLTTGFLGGTDGQRPNTITRVVLGHGVFVAGDFWCDVMPMNKEVWYRQVTPNFDAAATGPTSASQNQHLFHLGNATRNWEEPVPQWPSGFPQGNYWNCNFEGVVYDPSATFNPSTKKSHWTVAGPNYAFMFFTNQLPGASDVARNYARDVKYIDATRRDQVIYECGFPTNVGIDIKLTARQFTLNWNNMNDFLLYEFTFTNTGVVDIEGDGVVDQTNHKIEAFSFGTAREVAMGSGGAELSGTRGTDYTAPRLGGYVGDDDPDGNPWNMTVSFPGANPAVNPTKADFGMNNYSAKTFLDRWMGMSFLAVKQGTTGNPANPDKMTIFGTDPIGKGKNRGWFNASGNGTNLIMGTRFDALYNSGVPINGPKICFIGYSGAFYQDGGKKMDASSIRTPVPNAKFFASGNGEDPLSWVVRPSIAAKLAAGTALDESERPDGDQKLNSLDPTIGAGAFRQKWEDGTEDAGKNYPAGWGNWTKGFSWDHNFDCGLYTGVGPFSLDVNESVTVVFVDYAGYRLQGIQRALRSARWAYETKWAAPATAFNLGFTIPKAPDMKVEITTVGTTNIRWDDRAESDADFAGYKVWRSTNAPPNFNYIDGGMRLVDRYQEQMDVGPIKDEFKKPVNPKFAGRSDIAATSTKGVGQGREWGPYDLVAVVPKANLASVANTSGTYKYLYEDKTVIYGFDYWYYVSAYKEGSYAMYPGESIARIENSNLNRNGRTGLWMGTYSYADNNSNFPTTDAGKKDIGARFTVRSRSATLADLNNQVITPKVIPNPYKRAASFDNIQNSADHKIKFFNLPARGRLTILDVAGQIVDQISFDNQTGVSDVTWTMFSKDGIEVANGIYIFVVEAGEGVGIPAGGFSYVGKFAILR
ncbi:MAG: hypothetical protein H6Q31_962 [Bacteroidetes bacterium]|jgi:hypothetical protein|nr:hypothetical protein [Bacteroidota bacterium]